MRREKIARRSEKGLFDLIRRLGLADEGIAGGHAPGVAFTRCRPYRKNDQAWVEQKNGAVVRRMVGYRRFEGLDAAAELARLFAAVRLFVNFFQPSFKLAEKERDGARVRKRYHKPATPYQRLLADQRTPEEVRRRADAVYATLDPVFLLRRIRAGQQRLVEIADQPHSGEAASAPFQRSSSFFPGCAQHGRRARSARPRLPK
jgi:hypothetical protein